MNLILQMTTQSSLCKADQTNMTKKNPLHYVFLIYKEIPLRKETAYNFLGKTSCYLQTYVLIQSEKATSSSCRTECVVPSADACDIPLSVSKLVLFVTSWRNFVAMSFDRKRIHS